MGRPIRRRRHAASADDAGRVRQLGRRTAGPLTCLLATGAQGGYYALFTWLPTYLKVERKLSIIGGGSYIAVVIVGSFIGYLVSAHLADSIGRRANFLIFAVCSIVTVILYTQLPIDDTLMLFLGFPLGFFACGIFSGVGPGCVKTLWSI